MKWEHLLIWACIVHITDACFDDGGFYCAKLWYFWFVVFFIFVFILIGAIVATNLCKKKKRRVGPRGQRRTQRKSNAVQRGSKASILSRSTVRTDNTNSPQLSARNSIPEKAPLPQSSKSSPVVSNSKRIFTRHQNKENKNTSDVEKGPELSSPGKDTTVAMTTRAPPPTTLKEEDETIHTSQNLGQDIEDTTNC